MNLPRLVFETPQALRAAARRGEWTLPTAGQCPGFVQANLVVLPKEHAANFRTFCERNSQACPLLEETAPGDFVPRRSAPQADLRSDLPRYRLLGSDLPSSEPLDVAEYWRHDATAFLLGCSFTFEGALLRAGLPVRHIEEGRNVPMFRTNLSCVSSGPFAGPLVVSMRPIPAVRVGEAMRASAAYPRMHGAPVHAGDPAALGIADLMQPDFGQSVTIRPGEVPVFWACGVTPQAALENARLPWAICHSPGCMFVTDQPDELFHDGA